MRVFLYLVFLTLVLTLRVAHAAPIVRGTIDAPILSNTPLDELPNPNTMEANRIAVSLGVSSGALLEKGEQRNSALLGLNYRNVLDPRKIEADIFLHSQAIAGAFIGKRFKYLEDSPSASYLKISGGMYLPASEGPAAITAIKRFQIRGLWGWEKVADTPRLHLEAGVGVSVVGFEVIGSVGYIFSL